MLSTQWHFHRAASPTLRIIFRLILPLLQRVFLVFTARLQVQEKLRKGINNKSKPQVVLEGIAAKICVKKSDEEEEKHCILLGGVYLGNVYHTETQVESGAMYTFIKEDAMTWTEAEFAGHPLKEFFCPRPAGGYRFKPYYDMSVDHIVPSNLGGVDHPRNYAFMSRRLNSYFGDRIDEKLTIFPVPERRKVSEFATAAKRAANSAINAWLATQPQPMNTIPVLVGASSKVQHAAGSARATAPAAGGAGRGR